MRRIVIGDRIIIGKEGREIKYGKEKRNTKISMMIDEWLNIEDCKERFKVRERAMELEKEYKDKRKMIRFEVERNIARIGEKWYKIENGK